MALACFACLAFLAILAPRAAAQAFTEARFGAPAGFADEQPEADDSGQRFVFQRSIYQAATGEPCGVLLLSDCYVADLGACGSAVLRRITRSGTSLDPSISADGSVIAWRTYDAGASSDRNRIFVSAADGTGVEEVVACDGTVSRLELAPLGDAVAFLVTGRTSTSGTELIVTDTDGGALDVADSAGTGGITLNRDACLTAARAVVYTKLDGLTHDVFLKEWGSAPEKIVATTAKEERFASITADGTMAAFRQSVAGVPNLVELDVATSTAFPVTSNTSTGVAIHAVSASGSAVDGYHVLFESDGDYAAGNGDDSTELFRHSLAPSTMDQLTSFDASVFAPGRAVAGAALTGNGRALAYASGVATYGGIACDPIDMNQRAIWLAGPPVTVATAAFGPDVAPPFDLEPQIFSSCSVPAGTQDMECAVRVINGAEGARSFVLKATWSVPSGNPVSQHDNVGAFTLDPAESGILTLRYENDGSTPPDGTLDIHLSGPDVPMIDALHRTFTF